MKLFVVLFLLTHCVSVAETSEKKDFTCVAGNFAAGKPGNITCHFGPEIHNSNYHFEIVRYPFDAPGSYSGDDILRCHRLNSDLKCVISKGFEFDRQLRNNLTISIPQVRKDFAGRYACQLIPSDNRRKRLCNLRVTAEADENPAPRSEEGDTDSYDSKTVLIIAIIFGVLLIPCVVYVAFVLIRKLLTTRKCETVCSKEKRRRKKRKGAKTNEAAVDEEDASRQPFIINILPYDESRDDESQNGSVKVQEPKWHHRVPFREPYHRNPQNRALVHSDNDSRNHFVMPAIVPCNENDETDTAGLTEQQDSRPKTFTMPAILPVEKMNDEDKADQAPRADVPLFESSQRRPKWLQ